MPIVYNNKLIEDVYYGSTRIRQVYLGSKLIWERMRALYGWGYNNYGQLGVGDVSNRNTPTRVGTATNWASVSCGYGHTVAINRSGELYAWGYNNAGQLGLGDSGAGTNRDTPTQVGSAANWAAVSCGDEYTLAINTSGELYSWGRNSSGQLGLGDSGAGTDRTTPTRVGTATNWASVACGDQHALAINTAGELYGWGYNNYGSLGLGDTTNRTTPTRIGTATNWASVACGDQHTIAINTAGELYSCGYNVSGQLGLGDSGPGTNRTHLTRVGSATNWASVACGDTDTLAITTAGELYSCGYNYYGQLGLSDTTNRTTPTRVGTATNWLCVSACAASSMAITTAGELYGWGRNNGGQAGLGTSGTKSIPTRVGTDTNWVSVSSGHSHSIGIRS